MELYTERLFLRTITEEDAEIVRAFGKDEFASDEDVRNWIRWVKAKNEEGRLIVNFYIWLKDSDQCIGRVYIHSKPELNREVEIGYGIAEEYRNNGYAAEAAKAAVRYAFEETGQNILVAIVKPENTASRRVIEKLGFANNGVRTVPDENGKICEFDYFQFHREDWLTFA